MLLFASVTSSRRVLIDSEINDVIKNFIGKFRFELRNGRDFVLMRSENTLSFRMTLRLNFLSIPTKSGLQLLAEC